MSHKVAVSGLMVVLPGQEASAAVAALDLAGSDSCGTKELVIAGNKAAYEAVAGAKRRGLEVVWCDVAPELPLSEKLITMLGEAGGRIVCLWSAMDRCTSDRLGRQLEVIATDRAIGSALQSAIYYFPSGSNAYLVDYRRGSTTGLGGFMPLTLCVRQEAIAAIKVTDVAIDPYRQLFEYAGRCGKFVAPPDAFAVYLRTCQGRDAVAGQVLRREVTAHGLSGVDLNSRSPAVCRTLCEFGLEGTKLTDPAGRLTATARCGHDDLHTRGLSPVGRSMGGNRGR